MAYIWPASSSDATDELEIAEAIESELHLYSDDQIGLFYAPFDYVELGAKIAIVGVTPGPTQALEAIRCARAALRAGHDERRVQATVKYAASFKGMRRDLVSWFDAVGLADVCKLASCEDLFSAHARRLIHTTSAVRYPTFRRTTDGWQNWNGYGVGALEHRVLRAMICTVLGPELRAMQDAVIVPLGKANEAIEFLCRNDQLDASRCVLGFPHPSPASARRHEIFAARRYELARQVAALGTRDSVSSATEPSAADAVSRRDAPPATHDEITIGLTGGNVRNGHFYLRRHLSFFPSDAVGPANPADGTGTPLRVHFAGAPDAVETDIAGGNKLMFRCRRDVAAFFGRHGLAGGDSVAVRRIRARHYEVRPLRS